MNLQYKSQKKLMMYLHCLFVSMCRRFQIDSEDFVNFCGLLRKTQNRHKFGKKVPKNTWSSKCDYKRSFILLTKTNNQLMEKTFLCSNKKTIHENLNFVVSKLVMMCNTLKFWLFRSIMATYPWGASTTHRISPSIGLGDARL